MNQPASKSEIEIRHCSALDEYDECVKVEHETWGASLAVPSAIFVVAHHTGGQVLGAFDGPKMVGFTLGLIGVRAGNSFLHSHMTAVRSDYQNRRIGRALKLFQRDDALRRGIGVIEWTFDPLELKNAHFNLNRLGAIARRLEPNFYGVTQSPLHGGIPTDRLIAEWWLDSARVQAILAGKPPVAKGPVERVTLPSNIGEIRANDPTGAQRIQTAARGQLLHAFANGCVATGVESRGVRTDYILQPEAQVDGLEISKS